MRERHQRLKVGESGDGAVSHAHRFVTLWASLRLIPLPSLAASCIVGSPGAEFCVSSMLYSILLFSPLAEGSRLDGGMLDRRSWTRVEEQLTSCLRMSPLRDGNKGAA